MVSWVTDTLDRIRRQEWNKARVKQANENASKPKAKRGRLAVRPTSKSGVQTAAEALKSAKYPLLLNPDHLSDAYQAKLSQILLHNKRLATAYRLKEDMRLIFRLKPEDVKPALMK